MTGLDSSANGAWAQRSDVVEIRIDAYADDLSRLAVYLRRHRDRTWIVTCRSEAEGGRSSLNATERAGRLVEATEGTGALIDFEYADWKTCAAARDVLLDAVRRSGGDESRLILSSHDLSGRVPDVPSLMRQMDAGEHGIRPKVAYRVGHIGDTFAALDAMHECRGRGTVIAMGEDGLWTRVLAKKLGAWATYCALDRASQTAPGQLSLDEMVHRFRWADIDAATRVFGVIGDPVVHSMSPVLMNRWLAEAGINAVYLPLRVRAGERAVHDFLDACRQRPWLDIGGLSVTIPHKSAALEWVGDGADTMAKSIGAANTLSFETTGAEGYNTDCYAAVSSLVDALGCDRAELSGVRVDLLGSGGAARAVMHGLYELGCSMTVYGRSPEKTRLLADEYKATAAPWADRASRRGEILINGTSVGMWPDVEASPMPAGSLDGCRLVFDLIYRPLETRLLCEAKTAGAKALSGLEMFVRQAAAQFELWTGQAPDREIGRDAVRNAIELEAESPS